MTTKVVNKNEEPFDIYIGRGSIFGNPYEIGKDGTRDQVIDRYEIWFKFLLRDSIFANEVEKLRGKTLGCFCKRKESKIEIRCHGDIIVKHLNERTVQNNSGESWL